MPGSRLRWNEWITFRAKYCDLSPDAWVEFTLIGSAGPRAARTIGTARLELFDATRQLRTGVVKLPLDLALDGRAAAAVTTSIGASSKADALEMARLEDLSARHDEEVTSHPDRALDWLNRPTHDHLEQRQQAREPCAVCSSACCVQL